MLEKDAAAVETEQNNPIHPFIFNENVYSELVQHCLREKPLEACGLLSGKDKKAWTGWPMENILHNQNAFEMDIRQIETVFQQIEKKGEKLVGIYHSHPTTPPYPSPNDIANANYPNVVYIIVSLSSTHPDVCCFQAFNNRMFPIQHIIY